MNLRTVYPNESYRDLDVLQLQENALYGVSRLAEAVFGTATFVVGLGVGQNSPTGLSVVVNPGQLYQYAQAQSSAWSDLSPDSTLILQQGLIPTSTVLTIDRD